MLFGLLAKVNCCGVDITSNAIYNCMQSLCIKKTELTLPSTHLDAISEDYSA